MSKYIDAEKLIAEIDKRLSIFEHGIAYDCWASCKKLVNSLQQEQPKADLEKELRNYNVPFNDCGWERLTHNTLKEIARHFYELGLNARKEE